MNGVEILREAYGRLPELVEAAVRDLTPEQLRQAPAEGANTIGWLVWHLTRVQDSSVADVSGDHQVYVTGDWGPRFALKSDPSDTGYGHASDQVAAVAPVSWEALTGYHAAVHERTLAFLDGLTDADLDRVVDEDWDPPVTLGVRLVSVYDDAAQHAGQAAFVRGLR